MPILWKHLILQFFKVFCLTIFAFVAIALVSQLEAIAKFATFGSNYGIILLFAIYKIAFILPNIVPIAALIAATILYRQLSDMRVLNALRSGGINIRKITAPILLFGIFLTIVNFFIVSEVSTHSHFSSMNMIRNYAKNNPLTLLKSSTVLKNQKAYISMKTEQSGVNANDLIVVTNSKGNKSLSLIAIKELSLKDDELNGSRMSTLTPIPSESLLDFDDFSIENVGNLSMSLEELLKMEKSAGFRVSNDYLKMRFLLIKIKELKDKEEKNICIAEVFRRLSLAIAVFTFILMGIAYSIEIRRNRTVTNVLILAGLATITIASILTAKVTGTTPLLSFCFYFAPHIIIIIFSYLKLKRISRGLA